MTAQKGSVWIRIRLGALLPLLLLLYVPYQLLYYPRLPVVEWYSVFSEGTVGLFLLLALSLTDKLHEQPRLYWLLLTGFSLLLFSTATDVLDEFVRQPGWITIVFEDLLQLFGYPFVIAALYHWHALNRQWQETLQHQVVTDYLTGALNRRGFIDTLEQELLRSRRYSSPLSLIWFDLDRFKQVNDRYGHHVGDEVLHATARQTEDLIRQVDIFARMGGEEFCILLPETSLEGAVDVAEKLRRAFEQCDCSGEVRITASFGVGEYRPGEDGEQMLKRVDGALYRAKKEGRNRVISE